LASVESATSDERPKFADLKDIAQFERLSPNKAYLTQGKNEISAIVRVHADAVESVEYSALLTVNGQPYAPFSIVLTPGDITAGEKFTWIVNVNGKTVSARFRLIAVGNASKNGYEVVDVTKDYRVKRPPPPPRRKRKIHACNLPEFLSLLCEQ
jgi:hypothetical protein